MTLSFTTRLPVRHYELDAYGELPNSAVFRLFQETAMRATRVLASNGLWNAAPFGWSTK